MEPAGDGLADELRAAFEVLAVAARLGGARARRAVDPALRSRWLGLAAARAHHRDRLRARLAELRIEASSSAQRSPEPAGDVAALLRADLATAHAISARARRLGRLAAVKDDATTAALLERIAAESLSHAAELARALAMHYAREARASAQ